MTDDDDGAAFQPFTKGSVERLSEGEAEELLKDLSADFVDCAFGRTPKPGANARDIAYFCLCDEDGKEEEREQHRAGIEVCEMLIKKKQNWIRVKEAEFLSRQAGMKGRCVYAIETIMDEALKRLEKDPSKHPTFTMADWTFDDFGEEDLGAKRRQTAREAEERAAVERRMMITRFALEKYASSNDARVPELMPDVREDRKDEEAGLEPKPGASERAAGLKRKADDDLLEVAEGDEAAALESMNHAREMLKVQIEIQRLEHECLTWRMKTDSVRSEMTIMEQAWQRLEEDPSKHPTLTMADWTLDDFWNEDDWGAKRRKLEREAKEHLMLSLDREVKLIKSAEVLS